MAIELDEMLEAGLAIDPASRGLEVIEAWKALAQHRRAQSSESAREAERDARQAAWDRRVEARRHER